MSDLSNREVMARNLNRFLRERGLNRKEFAKAINVPYTTVLNWLNAESYPRIDKIELMARFFGVQKADLVEDSNKDDEMKLNRRVAFNRIRNATPEQIDQLNELLDLIWKEIEQ